MKFKYIVLNLLLFSLNSCTKDRIINPVDAFEPSNNKGEFLLHYWNFNDNTSIDNLISPQSIIPNAQIEYFGSAFDDVNEGSDLNTRNNDFAGRALRLRNPSGDLIISLPTVGYKNIKLKFASTRTNNGPQEQNFFYTTDGNNYINASIEPKQIEVPLEFQLYEIDFSVLNAVNNNPNFKVKVSFNINHDSESGNSRFDNITLEGKKI